ncbi:hypothetical protein GIB67_040122 [Kingdonia uniflora]|uniref:RRM domain-containing protein n=1 Tax=Kingdonia uniflora TaxID=39325 RepID=A0A7J7MV88_9MAGN|nr:hypothetical protein GIB67_040122 [Kingdonia uniflora]
MDPQQQWAMSAQAQTWGAQPQLQQQQQPYQPTTLEEIRTLWIGDLQYWVDEAYLSGCFSHSGEVLSIKIIRNKVTGQPEGYGFIEFVSHGAAERVLQSYNGTQMPGTEQTFRLNWASFGIGERRPDAGPEHSIFVGDLAPDVTDYLLQETFRAQYPSVRGAKVVTDPNTGRSKGYGFVKFAEEMERNRAMSEMNGVYCSTRPMRISAATPKKTTGFQQPYTAAAVAVAPKPVYPTPAYTIPAVLPLPVSDNDITNTTSYTITKLPSMINVPFSSVAFSFSRSLLISKEEKSLQARASAEEAIQRVHGTMVGQQIIRLSWGKNMTKVEVAQEMGGVIPAVEQREEYDPLSPPDVDKLNAAYLSVHGRAMVGRPMWLKTSTLPVQA